MAVPRVFVSSTCYDLQEVRFHLRNFIKEFGFEPVMSDFGDIFYDYQTHVHDSCMQEIKKSQLFVLIIGNNYGSIYHSEINKEIPDSVTLKEFREALEQKIYKHIFIDKFVKHDYENYKRSLSKFLTKYFLLNNVTDKKVNSTKQKLKQEFDSKYTYAQDSHKYIFSFLDILDNLQTNNGIMPFETFDEIKEGLRKQWAGFMFDSLTRDKQVSSDTVISIKDKIEIIENQLAKLLEVRQVTKKKNITLDITNLTKEIDINKLEELKNKTFDCLQDILFSPPYSTQRIYFKSKFDDDKVRTWLENLKELIKSYKWSKYIDLHILFDSQLYGGYRYLRNSTSIPYKSILELHSIYVSLSKEDKISFINTVKEEFNKNFEEVKSVENNPSDTSIDPDDLPF